MNTRLTIMLAGVLIVLLGGVWYAGNTPPPPATPTASGGPTLISAGAEDITEIAVQSGGQQVTARRAASGDWTYATGGVDLFAPADNQRIRSLTTRLAGMKAQSTISEQPDAAALKEYGLDSPAMRAVVKTAAGDRTLVVGADNARRTGKYVRMGDSGPVYLAEAFLLQDLASLTTQPPTPPTPTATTAAAATPTP